MKRNFLFYVYPKNPESWGWHIARIQRLWTAFNGRKIVVIATDRGTEPSKLIEKMLQDNSVEFLYVDNDPQSGETKHFIPALERLQSTDPNEATFYAHAKGVIHSGEQLKKVLAWCDAMYTVNLERPDLIDRLLARYDAVGCFKHPHGAVPTPSTLPSAVNAWFFAGTFFWLKHSALFTKNWRDIGDGRYGVEAYLCRHIETQKAFSLTPFLDAGQLYGNPPNEVICRKWLDENLRSEGIE